MTMQPDLMKSIRSACGLSQEDFATQLGVSRKTVNEMETGKVPVDTRTANAVRWLDPLRPAFTVGGKLHGRGFFVGQHVDRIEPAVPGQMAQFVSPRSKGSRPLVVPYIFSGFVVPETGERVFVPADEEGWSQHRAAEAALSVIEAWQKGEGPAHTE